MKAIAKLIGIILLVVAALTISHDAFGGCICGVFGLALVAL